MTEQSMSWEHLATAALASGETFFGHGDHASAAEAYSTALEALDDAARAAYASLAAQLHWRHSCSAGAATPVLFAASCPPPPPTTARRLLATLRWLRPMPTTA